MYGTLVVNSWVGIHEGCDITYNLSGSDGVYVTVSGKAQPFEFFFDVAALRKFVELGGKALTEMAVPANQDEAEGDARERAERDQAAERSA